MGMLFIGQDGGPSGREAYLDWKERINCTYAKYDDEDCTYWRENK